jgi:hypothetical protein
MASEVGVVDIDQSKIVRKGRLQPGRMLLIDTNQGRIVEDDEIKQQLSAAAPYQEWLDAGLVELGDLPAREHVVFSRDSVLRRQQVFGYTHEELKIIQSQVDINQVLVLDMVAQGKAILSELYQSLEGYLAGYEVVATEQPLYERIQNFDFEYNFKGFIDLVLKTPDGKIHIIDWKTCSWGWDTKKKSDPMVTYQLTYYKNFYAQKFNIDPKMIETHFALLKRTAKKNRIEFFRVSSGTKKIENANNLLTRAILAIKNGKYIKNRLSCKGCEFYKTDLCK